MILVNIKKGGKAMSKLISLKDSLKQTVDGGIIQTQRSQNHIPTFTLSSEFFFDTFKMLLQYKHAKDKIDSDTKNDLERIRKEHEKVMTTLHHRFSERNESLEEAKMLIRKGIETNNEGLILYGVELLKKLIETPINNQYGVKYASLDTVNN